MPSARKPAVHRANMSLGSTCAYLSGEEGSDRRTGRRFWSQEIQATFPAPFFIAGNSRKNGFLHLLGRGTGIQHSPCLSEHCRVVDFKLIGWVMYFEHRMASSDLMWWVVKGLNNQLSQVQPVLLC